MMFRAALLLSLVLSLSACVSNDPNIQRFQSVVTPVQTDETADVPALILARGMAETGFTRAEILEHGPAIRNAVATAGAAQIADGGRAMAMVSVMDGRLFIVSQEHGTTVIPITGAPL